jgi:hypothetical protein
MAPEHLNGQPADLRTDVFAFGVLMYEYATGRHPFDAPTAIARAGRVLTAEPEPVGRYRADLPASLVSVLDRCLAKAPDERFASAIDVMGALPEAETVGSRAVPLVGPPSSATALGDTSWWRMHQFVVIGLYFVAVIVAWFVKEGLRGPTSAVFIAMSVLGTVLGMLRGHLVFTASTHAAGLPAQRRRVTPITLVGDLLMATLLAGDGLGWIIGASREVAGVLTIALAVGLVVARLVLEPTTTKAAFGG